MIDHVNYQSLDKAKNAFIEASKKTLAFAKNFGFVPDDRLGASANIFCLDLKSYLKNNADKLYITLLPEGLGTADDARPSDLNKKELIQFWYNIGIKTISCLTNDASSAGMQTVLISLYLPSADPDKVFSDEFLDGFLNGFVHGCKIVGCAWISGETPQLKGKICEDKLDIAGALFGIMPAAVMPIDGTKLKTGNKIVFVESSGPHENGFTTLRQLAQKLTNGYREKLSDGREYWQAINEPSLLYTPLVQKLLAEQVAINSIENVTGHGWQKIMRSKTPLRYHIKNMLAVPNIFQFIEEKANISKEEMLKIFNYGVGCAIFVEDNNAAERTIAIAKSLNIKAVIAGEVLPSNCREVFVEPLGIKLTDESFTLGKG
jgi:phosphoribosylformylglycinamidine cyclo-ligase